MKVKRIFIFLLIFFLYGCWDKRELNELAIVVAMGIDKINDQYVISAQVVVPSELSIKGGPGHSSVTLYKAKGDTIYTTFRELSKISPRIMYPGHLQMLVIGESMAEEGLNKPFDFIERNWEFRTDFYVIIAKENTAEEILNIQTPVETIPGTMMYYTLKNSDKLNPDSIGVTFQDFKNQLEDKGKQPVLTGIQLKGEEKKGSDKANLDSITPSAQIKYDGLAIFFNDKLKGWMQEKDAKSLNIVTNRIKKAVIPTSCPNDEEGKVDVEIQKINSKMTGKVKKGEPSVDINIQVKGNVGAVECKLDLKKVETIVALEKIFEKEQKTEIEQSIKKTQKQFQSDIYGFGSAIYRDDVKAWRKLKGNWDEEYFNDVQVNVKVNLILRNVGAMSDSFK